MKSLPLFIGIFIVKGTHKNIFACLFSVHDIISLHVMNKYV